MELIWDIKFFDLPAADGGLALHWTCSSSVSGHVGRVRTQFSKSNRIEYIILSFVADMFSKSIKLFKTFDIIFIKQYVLRGQNRGQQQICSIHS